MSTNLKTLTLGGTEYAVNAPVVTVDKTLAEAASKLDFGPFTEGLTELYAVTKGVTGTEGTYLHWVVNGVKTAFIVGASIYTDSVCVHIKKTGSQWYVWVNGGVANIGNSQAYISSALSGVDAITSFAIEAYSGSTFAAGTKFALEGR